MDLFRFRLRDRDIFSDWNAIEPRTLCNFIQFLIFYTHGWNGVSNVFVLNIFYDLYILERQIRAEPSGQESFVSFMV